VSNPYIGQYKEQEMQMKFGILECNCHVKFKKGTEKFRELIKKLRKQNWK